MRQHCQVFQHELQASSYAVNFWQDRGLGMAHTLDEAWQDPEWQHLRKVQSTACPAGSDTLELQGCKAGSPAASCLGTSHAQLEMLVMSSWA